MLDPPDSKGSLGMPPRAKISLWHPSQDPKDPKDPRGPRGPSEPWVKQVIREQMEP